MYFYIVSQPNSANRLFVSSLIKVFSYCAILIYNEKYIFGLCPFLGAEILKALEFPALRALCYANEVI